MNNYPEGYASFETDLPEEDEEARLAKIEEDANNQADFERGN